MRPDFWKNKSVFVTGHTGFKGAWLSLWLQRLGARVIGYATAPPTEPSLFERASVSRGMISIIGDVRDFDELLAAVNSTEPEIVFHLAAQSLVRRSYEDPRETFSSNVMGTVNLLDALRVAESVRAAVVVTSDKCYENSGKSGGYCEEDAMGGHDPYSCSKGCAELVTASYRRSFFESAEGVLSKCPAIASARAGNVMGGGDWARDRLAPDLIRALENHEPARIRNPLATRPWQHVLESLSGYMTLAEALFEEGASVGGGWNFGPDEGNIRPVGELSDGIIRHWADGGEWVEDGSSAHPHEARLLELDSSKARSRLGWRPLLDFEETLAWTVEWYKGLGDGGDGRELTLGDIDRYQSRVERDGRG